jgi:hypothetical protein
VSQRQRAKQERDRMVKAAKIAAHPRHEHGSLMDMLHRNPARPPEKSLHMHEWDNVRARGGGGGRAESHVDGGKLITPSRDVSQLSNSRPVDLLLPPTPRRCQKRPSTEVKETHKHATTPRHPGSSATTPGQPATSPRRPVTGDTERWRESFWSNTGGGSGWFGAHSIGSLRTGRPSLAEVEEKLQRRPITSGIADGVSQSTQLGFRV